MNNNFNYQIQLATEAKACTLLKNKNHIYKKAINKNEKTKRERKKKHQKKPKHICHKW